MRAGRRLAESQRGYGRQANARKEPHVRGAADLRPPGHGPTDDPRGLCGDESGSMLEVPQGSGLGNKVA